MKVIETNSYNTSIISNYLFENTTLLKTSISYYYFQSSVYKESIEKINKFIDYKIQNENIKLVNDKNLALDNYFYVKEKEYPFHNYEYILENYITFNKNCLLCFYFDNYTYYGGAHGNTIRKSYNFNLKKGTIIKLKDIIKPNSFDYIFVKMEEIINNEREKYSGLYGFNALKENFNKNNFYLTEEGLVIYYGLYEVAPYVNGIVTFLFPYNEYIILPSC